MERRRRPARLDAAAEPMTKTVRRREKPRERWLLTRKTWKYMSDAGRRLIPDGAQNRLEDVPRIEAYFQDVCAKEPRFLLWRKSSYPGAIPRPRRKKRPRGGSVRARSPSDDVPTPAVRPTDLFIPHTSGGRFDIAKLRRDFFAAPPPASSSGAVGRPTREPVGRAASREPAEPTPDEIEESNLVDLIRKYLKIEENKGISKVSESEELVRALRKYLKRLADRFPSDSQAGPSSSLLSYLSRYYRGTDNEHRVQDLLTDTDLLKKLCQDLRKTKPYRGSRSGGGGSGYSPLGYGSSGTGRGLLRTRAGPGRTLDGEDAYRSPPMSPPPLIEVFSESLEDKFVECGTQTVPIPEDVLVEIERAYRERMEAATAPTSPTSPPAERKPGRRRSSIDHEDVSQSVSDTIKRYFKMARKKSVDADKADKFKRINYDKNLRNIKPKNRGDFDDDGLSKGCNTVEDWIMTYRDFNFSGVESPPASPSQSHSFLSTLLGRGTVGSSAGGMQKSRSSSSVVSSVSKRLWRTRSRSSSRVASSWVPQGSCCWADGSGRFVRLTDTSLLTLSEVERRALQQAALARLQQINLGTTIKIPEENASAVAPKPKRRAYLLKQKALTTGFFDQRAKDEKDKDGRVGSVFGVPLAQCVETERALRRQQHGGSRASLASLGATEKGDDSDTSGEWCWAGLEEAGGGGPRVPALVSACLAHLRQHGLHTLGLFRVSASKKRVRQLREEWERSQEAALDAAVCPHDVGTLLKEFLRDLPDPLLCRDLYSAFLYTQKIRHRGYQWEAVRLIVQLLPAAHRDTLHALLSFLSQLASHAEDQRHHPPGNKMDAANLATVFAPNILHRDKPNEKASVEQLSERSDVINVVRQLVERQAELWTLPAEMLHEAYITLAHDHPDHLHSLLTRRAEMSSTSTPVSSTPDAASGETRRIWSREQFLHQAAATGGNLSNSSSSRRSESHVRRRGRDAASDTSSGSVSSALTILTRVRSSMEECGSSGVVCSPPHDSNDSASDCTEPLGCSDDDNVVITASLHLGSLPAPARAPAAPPRRRSTSQQDKPDSNRDSAVGSSSPASASNASSPPASPPPAPATPTSHPAPPAAPQRVTVTAGEVYSGTDIDRLLGLAKERNTSDARAVILRQQDDSTVTKKVQSRTEVTTRREDKKEVKREEKKEERREEKKTEKKDGPMLYKRGQIISSTRLHTP